VAKLRKRREVAGAGLTSRMACKWLGIIDQTCWRIRSARVRRTRRAVGVGPVGVSCCVACEINLRSCLRLEENRAGRSRGLPGVYVFAVSSLRPPPRPRPIVRAMRLRATARALTRQRINARNEGVRGSSPRVGSPEGPAKAGLSLSPTATGQVRVKRHGAIASPNYAASAASPAPHVAPSRAGDSGSWRV
jgi:hypothetical protein